MPAPVWFIRENAPVGTGGTGIHDRSYAASFNYGWPFIIRDRSSAGSGVQDHLLGADYATIFWLEENRYDFAHIAGANADRLGPSWFEDATSNNLLKAFTSVDHHEFWPGAQRANLEGARDADVNPLLWRGKEADCNTSYTYSIDPSNGIHAGMGPRLEYSFTGQHSSPDGIRIVVMSDQKVQDASPLALPSDDQSRFVSTTVAASAAVVHTTSPASASVGAGTASPATEPLTVATDKGDYAPGSTATITVTGVNPGSSVSFQVADLATHPGLNGLADVYAPFSATDGGSGDSDGLVNGGVVTEWHVPSDGSATGATLQLTATSGNQTATTTFTDAANPIVTENARAGTPQSYWNVPHSDQIEGFTTDFSVNAGERVDFKINVNGTAAQTLPYKIEIFRLGYYGGDGARLVTTLNNADGTVQPNPIRDTTLGLVDAGNWAVTDNWQVPADAVSGGYLARLQRLDANGNPIDGAVNQIPFVVRNDGHAADIVLQTSDTTWQAYNGWSGNNGQVGANFYGDASGTINHPPVPDPGLGAQNRAYAVSYNRPFITDDARSPASGAHDYLFGADYAAIFWLEKNGYDLTYMSGVDTDRLGTSWFEDANGNNIRKAYISVGHDEYWSGAQRANVEAARDAGVNLLFWSGNEVYWKTRYADSIDGSGTDHRTLVSYKETWANGDPSAGPASYANIDPSNEWTGTWRDTRFVDSVAAHGVHTAVGALPENALTGQLFRADGTGELGGALDVPAQYAGLRVWRGTAVANGSGTFDIAPGLIGYEWDVVPEDQYRPAGLIKLSETTLNWSELLLDQGNHLQSGTATHNLTLYRAASGALVIGSATVFWGWGLVNE